MGCAGVFYLLTGPSHGVRLAVSLWSLRRHYQGPVTVYSSQSLSHEIARLLAADRRLDVEHLQFPHYDIAKNSSFITKLDLLPHVKYDPALYLDADTLIVGDILPLLTMEEDCSLHVTQFAHWLTDQGPVRRRLERWRGLSREQFASKTLDELIQEAIRGHAAVNGGVFSFRPGARAIRIWLDLALVGWKTFICDEVALQLLLPQLPHKEFDCRFNACPMRLRKYPDVRIWHFHGEKHLNKPVARELWWPHYDACLQENIGGLREWTPGGDRRLAGYVKGLEK